MARNQKLTKVIQDRKVAGIDAEADALKIRFDDGSTMTVRTAGAPASLDAKGTVKAVRQQDTRLSLDLEDGKTVEIETAEPTSSVILRDKNNVLEYAD